MVKVECLACKSNHVTSTDTIVSEFIAEKVFDVTKEFIPVNLYHCEECGFSFYSKRFTDEETAKLYLGYRLKEYQKMRQKYDSWYTPEINEALSNDDAGLMNRRALIGRICHNYLHGRINRALDYGGDTGSIYPAGLDIDKQCVFDISRVETVAGVIRMDSYEAAQELDFDLIMCNHVLEHVNDLDDFIGLVKGLGNENTLFYFEVPFDSPYYGKFIDNFQFLFNPYFSLKVIFERFLKMKRLGFFAPMVEHVNYFSPYALEKLLSRNGLTILDLQINRVDYGWAKNKCISSVCRLA
jgi:predicted nucleic-acid-binding Zn-ribbon protein